MVDRAGIAWVKIWGIPYRFLLYAIDLLICTQNDDEQSLMLLIALCLTKDYD